MERLVVVVELGTVHHLHIATAECAGTSFGRKCDSHLLVTSLLCGDNNNTVGTLRTVDSGRGSVLEYCH